MAHNLTAAESLKEEGGDLLRGAAGGLIFGTPLLFTMEMWFHGMRIAPEYLLAVIVLTSCINICFSFASGLRRHNKEHTITGAMADAVTAMAIGIVVATIILGLIGQLNSDDTWDIFLGKILIEASAVSLGVTFTNTKFPKSKEKRTSNSYKELEDAPLSLEQKQARLDFQNLAAVIGGAVIFSFNIAPTEEVILIASSQSTLSILILALSQIVVCYIILYAADFKERKVFKESILQSPAAEISMTIAFAWIVSAIMLLLLGTGDVKVSFDIFLACVVTVGFPAVIGGAAGKVIV